MFGQLKKSSDITIFQLLLKLESISFTEFFLFLRYEDSTFNVLNI